MYPMEYVYAYVLILSSILLVSIFFSYNKKASRTVPVLPGKTGLPVFGETLELLFNGRKGHPEIFFFDRISKYSSQVFGTHLFGEQLVVLCGANGNKFLFSNENKLVQGWYPKSTDKIFLCSTQTSSQEEAIRTRKMLPNFFKPEALQRYVGLPDQVTGIHFVNEWEKNQEVVTLPLTKRYTFRLACKILVSVENPLHENKFAKWFDQLTSGVFSIPIDFPGTPFRKAIKASECIRKELVSIIKQRKIDLVEGKASPTQDILSHMVLSGMEEQDISNKILGLFLGSLHTTSSTCTFVVKYLAEMPQIYNAVYKEQMEIAKSKAPGELLTWDDIQKMKYSWNVACEVLRLAPPVQGTFRQAIADFKLNGFSISKGWKLYSTVNSTHRDPEVFPEPLKFDPSRFEGSGPAPYTFVPFGGGPRMCPGKEYARLVILVFMHHLVKRFKWEKKIPNEKIVVDLVSSVPVKGLPVRLFPHKK